MLCICYSQFIKHLIKAHILGYDSKYEDIVLPLYKEVMKYIYIKQLFISNASLNVHSVKNIFMKGCRKYGHLDKNVHRCIIKTAGMGKLTFVHLIVTVVILDISILPLHVIKYVHFVYKLYNKSF